MVIINTRLTSLKTIKLPLHYDAEQVKNLFKNHRTIPERL
jgi:hypothetical protein